VAEKLARELLLTGRIIGARDAYRMGLVNELVEDGELHERARRLSAELLENSPASMRATKALLRSYDGGGLSRDLDLGLEANASMRLTADFREGVERVEEAGFKVSKFQGFKVTKLEEEFAASLRS
jgi:methylglutaconyl-CoA hydratase